jgi:hypothetical protein
MRALPAASLALLCMAVAAMHLLRGMPLPGWNSGYDGGLHIVMLTNLAQQPWRGGLPPLWFFEATAGLGSPAPIFYGPGAYLPALALLWLGMAPDTALSAVLALARVLGGVGVTLWVARRGASASGAAVAGAIWLLFPASLLHGPLMGFRYAETVAVGLLPWLLLAADRAMLPGQRRIPLLLIALGYGLLAITHLQQTLLAALIIPAWVAATRGRRAGFMVMLGGVAGAALAGWFLLPAALLRPLINEEGWNAAARMAQMALFSGAEAGPVAASWAMLYLSWALGLGLALAGMARPGGGAACARCAALLCLSMVPPLTWLWPHLPIIVYVQFPWRHMPWLSLMAGGVAAGLWMAGGRARRVVMLMLACMALLLLYPWADRLLPPWAATAYRDALLQYPVERDPARFHQPFYAEFMPPEYLPAAAISSGLGWQAQDARRAILARICAAQPCAVLDRRRPGQPRAMLPQGEAVLLPLFHWPGLRCTGCELSLDIATGLARARLLPGRAPLVVISAAALPVQRLGLAISAAALLAWLVALALSALSAARDRGSPGRGYRRHKAPAPPP